MADLDEINKKILSLLARERLKPNKLRKKVMDMSMKTKYPDLTWDDFTSVLDTLKRKGTVIIEAEEEGDTLSEYCVLVQKGQTKCTPSQNGGKKRLLDKNTHNVVTEDDSGTTKKTKFTSQMDVPGKFIPFLLRQSGSKLKNIEVNTKTTIQCDQKKTRQAEKRIAKSPGTSLSTLQAVNNEIDGEADNEQRLITISGGEEKHIKAAQILLDSMIAAFMGKPRPVYAPNKNKHKEKRNKKNKNKSLQHSKDKIKVSSDNLVTTKEQKTKVNSAAAAAE